MTVNGGKRTEKNNPTPEGKEKKRPIVALDLFCGAGGSAVGLNRAGFEVIGYDKFIQPEYPFEFIQSDITKMKSIHFDFDFVWASPPCQRFSEGGNKESRLKYPNLIEKTRKMLLKTGKPFVIENVRNAPIRHDLMLCGEMFGLRVLKHRYFEIHGFKVRQLNHPRHLGRVTDGSYMGVYTGGRCGCYGNNKKRDKLKVGTIQQWQIAMGIKHVSNRKMLAEAIPPAYSEYIAREYLWQM